VIGGCIHQNLFGYINFLFGYVSFLFGYVSFLFRYVNFLFGDTNSLLEDDKILFHPRWNSFFSVALCETICSGYSTEGHGGNREVHGGN
jgi:hypothetical protein